VFVRIFGGVVLNTVINEGDFLRISDGHFNNNNKFKKFKIYDELKTYKVDDSKYFFISDKIIRTNFNIISLN